MSSYLLVVNEPKMIKIENEIIDKVLNELNIDFDKFQLSDERISYEFEFRYKDSSLYIFLDRNKESLSLEGELNQIIDFILKLVYIVSKNDQKLLFFDQGYNNNMTIDSKTSREDIKSVFSY